MKHIITIFSFLFSFIAFAQDVNMQTATVNQCGGVFRDSGDEFANYGDNENFILTICPENAGQKVQLDFTFFSTQLNVDIMSVFDGDDTTAPPFGDFSGAGVVNSPGMVEASAGNASGCITIQFVSDGSASLDGWEANISCRTPCQDITAQLDATTPAVDANGEVLICAGGDVTFEGSGVFSVDGTGATYDWDFGNSTTATGQTVTATYDSPGIYVVDLVITDTNPMGCSSTNSISQVVRVSPEIDFTGTQAADTEICFGESTTITGVATIPQFEDCAPEIFDQTWLEDTPTTGQATSYTSTITVDCYGPGQLLTEVTQITDFCAVLEHSFMGDLTIILEAPNGAQVVFLEYGDGTDPGDDLGIPDQADNGNPGTGLEYCFSPTATQTLDDASVVGTAIPAGTYAPLASSSFDNILGTPLNGDWTFIIIDSWAADDGTLFSWNLNFDPSLVPPSNTIVSESWDADPTITNTTGNVITVEPGASGEFCYTYRAIDDFGCEYTEEVCINVTPEIVTEAPDNLFICDNGIPPYIFDLESNTDVVLASAANATDLVVTYHNSQADADADTGAITGLNNYSGTDGEIIYIRVEYENSGCYEVLQFTLNISGQPIINAVPDLELCDDASNDGSEEFDLSSQTAGILGAQAATDFNVTYHLSSVDAIAGMNALPDLYTNMNNPEPIYVRIESAGDSNCFNAPAAAEFNLIVNPSVTPVFDAIAPICEGEALAPLPTTSNNGVTGTWSPSLDNTTTTIYTFTPDGGQDCALETTLEIIVNPLVTPEFNAVDPICSGDTLAPLPTISNNGVTGVWSPAIDNTATTVYTFTPDAGQNCTLPTTLEIVVNPVLSPIFDAVNPICSGDSLSPLPTTSNNGVSGSWSPALNNTTTTVYTFTPDATQVCALETTLQIVVNPLITPEFDPVTPICLGDTLNPLPTISNNGIAGSWSPAIDDTVTTVYTFTPDGGQDCVLTTTMEIIVNPLPSLVVPTVLEVCDDGTPDGLTSIDLSLKNGEISGNNPNYSVSYYLTQADADAEVNPLPIPYTNTSNCQTIFARVEDINTGCYDTTTLELCVEQAPVANTPQPLRYCDPDNDGFGIFDLTDADNAITGGAPGLTVTYHETFANADNNVDAIDTSVPYNNIVADNGNSDPPIIIYARVESATIATDCATIVELELIVEPSPQIVEPTPLEECDDASADGFAIFDLTTKAPEVLGGLDPMQYTVSYYESEENAEMDNNPIANPNAYTNTMEDSQMVWIRVEDINTVEGCYKVTSLMLIVNPLPVLVQPMPLELCDVDNPGDEQEPFTLEDANAEILDGQNGITLTYYETQMDADNATNPIASPYQNISTAQTIYIRGENDITGCHSTVTLTLRVNPLPSPEQNPEPIAVCDDDNDGFAEFNLTLRTVEITNGESDVVITYHETQEDADMGDNALSSPYTNIVANSQMIYVRSESTLTGCYRLTQSTLELIVVPSPEVPTDIEPIIMCDDGPDGITQFDLTERDADILGSQNPADVELTYHVTSEDAETGDNPIINVGNYTNVSNPQTVYVRFVQPDDDVLTTRASSSYGWSCRQRRYSRRHWSLCDDLGESPGDEMTVFRPYGKGPRDNGRQCQLVGRHITRPMPMHRHRRAR